LTGLNWWLLVRLNWSLLEEPRIYFLVFALEMIVAGGLIGATIFGLYLWITSRTCDINHNDAFSSMRLDSHRHFLRIRIKDDMLTIYPICLDTVPKREEWIDNEKSATDPTEPWFASVTPLTPRLIEGPIVINARMAPPAAAPKPPAAPPA
jgi:hypothetical protein